MSKSSKSTYGCTSEELDVQYKCYTIRLKLENDKVNRLVGVCMRYDVKVYREALLHTFFIYLLSDVASISVLREIKTNTQKHQHPRSKKDKQIEQSFEQKSRKFLGLGFELA